jgi:hypothetical protein
MAGQSFRGRIYAVTAREALKWLEAQQAAQRPEMNDQGILIGVGTGG